MNLSTSLKITKGAATGAATSDVNGPTLDMAGYTGALIITTFATPAADNYLQAEQDTASGMGTAATLEGSKVTPSGASDECAWIEIVNPSERYIRAVAKRGTSSALGEIYCLQYGGPVGPVSNVTAGAMIGELLVSPAEGTP